jgi:hypothetical protein
MRRMARDRSIRLRSEKTVARAGSSRSRQPKPEPLLGPLSPHQDQDGLHQGGGDADPIGFVESMHQRIRYLEILRRKHGKGRKACGLISSRCRRGSGGRGAGEWRLDQPAEISA